MFRWNFFQTSNPPADLSDQTKIKSPIPQLMLNYPKFSYTPVPPNPELFSDIEDQKKLDMHITLLKKRHPHYTEKEIDEACKILIGKPVSKGKIVPLAERSGFVELEADDIETDMVMVPIEDTEEDALTQSFVYIPGNNGL
ncbi:hypothetical protein ACFORL_11105 [Legionella dresdenensis]|uniref:Uncharacterized protein n=1 Tax=Legionella dresdenensis TaxID=450200 RepID=A0ABV8CHB3_9GAMM